MFTDSPRRTAQINVRVTVAEREALDRVASRAGMTIGQLVRRALARETQQIAAHSVEETPPAVRADVAEGVGKNSDAERTRAGERSGS